MEVVNKRLELSAPQTKVFHSTAALGLDMAGQRCFAAGTLVNTSNGYKPIELIESGEFVLSVDLFTGRSEYRRVIDKCVYLAGQERQDVITFLTRSNETIKCTATHEIYFEGTWLAASGFARRIMEVRDGIRKEICGKQLWTACDKSMEGREFAGDNETSAGRARVFAHNVCNCRKESDGENAPRSCSKLAAKSQRVFPSKPHQRNKNRQPGGKLGMVQRRAKYSTCVQDRINESAGRDARRRKKQHGHSYGGGCCFNPSKICPLQIHACNAGGGVRGEARLRERHSFPRNVEACAISLQDIVSIEFSKESIDLYDLHVAANRNYTVTESDFLVHNSGKSQMIGIMSGRFVKMYPRLKGFIAANTYMQLTQSTLIKTTEIWRDYYGYTEYDRKTNRTGDYVVDKRPPGHFKTFEKYKEYHNIISFRNGATVFVGSLDNYKAHDGKEFAWAHLDETKDTKEVALTSVILARLSQRGLFVDETGELVFRDDFADNDATAHLTAFNPCWIHTSPAVGQVDWLVKMFSLEKFEPQIRKEIMEPDDFFYKNLPGGKTVIIYSTHHNAKNLPRNYIAGREAVLSENEQMKFIYGYPFAKTGSEFYPRFQRLKHVRAIRRNYGLAAHLTFDYNVVPYMTTLAAQVYFKRRYQAETGEKFDEPAPGRIPLEVMVIEFFKEYCLKTPYNTTEDCCKHFIDDYAGSPGLDVFLYGDASGRNRIEGLGSLTNVKIIKDLLAEYISEGSDRVRKANISVLKRRNLMNRLFEGKYPTVEIYFDEEMEETIRDFEYLKLGVDGKLKETEKDKETGALFEKIGHTSDAADYLVCEILIRFLNENM